MPNANIYKSIFAGQEIDLRLSEVSSLRSAVADLVAGLSDTYTKAQVDAIAESIAAAVDATSAVVVDSLPTAGPDTLGKIYYVGPEPDNTYYRAVTAFDGTSYTWLMLGNTDINLADYAKVDDVENMEPRVDGITGDLYTEEVIDRAEVPEQDLSFGAATFNNYGKFQQIYVNAGDIVEVTAGNNGPLTAAFRSSISCPNSGSSSNVIQMLQVPPRKTATFLAPSNAVAFAWITQEVVTTDFGPASVKVWRVPDPGVRVIPCQRFGQSGGALAYAAYSTTRNVLVRVKAGHTVTFAPVGNATYRMDYLSELPRIGAEYTAGTLNPTSASLAAKSSRTFTVAQDTYYFIRLYKSSSPELTITATDLTGIMDGMALLGRDARIEALEAVSDKLVDNTLQWRQINTVALPYRSRVITGATGLWGTGTTYKHVLVPVKPGQYVKFTPGVAATYMAFLTNDEAAADNAAPSYVAGTSLFSFTAAKTIIIPAGCNSLYVALGASPYENRPAYLAVTDYPADLPDMVRMYDPAKTKRILDQLVSQTRAERATATANKPLVLLHYSDIHGQAKCQDNINAWREYWKQYIDDTIQTGDILEDRWTNDFIFGDGTDPDNPSKDIMSVIGNHDTATGTGDGRNWHAEQGKPAYDRFIAPFVENWDVTQPEGAGENGYCFYYKDYPDSHVRLIVLDAWNNDAAYIDVQKAWLTGVLAAAREAGLSVLMASHFSLKSETLLKSTFSNPGAAVDNPDSSVYNDPYKPIVTSFVNDGGELVGWICGHSHYDAITRTSAAQGSQICFKVANACRAYTQSNELYITNSRIEVVPDDFKTQNLFNIIAIDTTYKTVSLFRVGSEWDKMGRHIVTTCVKYTTGEVIYG